MEPITDLFVQSPLSEELKSRLREERAPLILEGPTSPAKAYLLAGIARDFPKVAVIAASDETARDLYEDLLTWLPDQTAYYPVADPWSGSDEPEIAAQRVLALDLMTKPGPVVLVGPIQAMLQRTAGEVKTARLRRGETVDLERLLARLAELGYERGVLVERPGQFALRGGILDVFPSTEERPVRVELFDDQVESIRIFDVEDQRSLQRIEEVEILPAREAVTGALGPILLQVLPEDSLVVMDEPNRVAGHWEEYHAELRRRQERQQAEDAEEVALPGSEPSLDLFLPWQEALDAVQRRRRLYLNSLPRTIDWDPRAPVVSVVTHSLDRFAGQMSELARSARERLEAGDRAAVVTHRHHRLAQLMADEGLSVQTEGAVGGGTLYVRRGRLSAGFRIESLGLTVYSDLEVFGERHMPRPRHHFKSGTPIASLLDLREGDYVVHINHGIGVYRGLARLQQDGTEHEFLRIDYAAGDKIYVPTDQLDRVQRYVGGDDAAPQITRLGTNTWQKTTTRAKQRVREMAKDLLQLYAARAAAERPPFSPDTVWQTEVEEAFPYRETADQLKAIQESKQDMEGPKPMDRLICGDVGYGKTEVAVRAAFKAVADGRQVAVLVPTTVLAQQHYDTFSERMEGFPVRIELLSRFRTASEQKRVLEGLEEGSVDIVIGTHMLLGKRVKFSDLGLLIVDEEQRFGVAHKEKLKQLKKSVDVMTLTATPIPRTMHMALSGLRDMSVINNPPEGRAPIKTYVGEYSDQLVRRALNRELDRGGQVYFVFNRVEKIEHMAARVEKLVPHAKVGVGHGQMPERVLEQVMWDFYHKKFDILVCTTIIESGLDIPNVNTIVVMDADHLGLSQLYQLRGRVGRSDRQAYCYLFYRRERALTETAQKRLEAIRDFTDLGSGFRVAMRDLEIRGAGNLLGAEQSGVMVSVGFELYCQMIADAIKELRGEQEQTVTLPPVELSVDAFVPEEYIPTEGLRIAFYKKLAAVTDVESLKALQAELEDRFGDPPTPVWNLLALVRTRLLAHELGLRSITGDKRRARFNLSKALSRGEMLLLRSRIKSWNVLADQIEVMLRGEDTLREVDHNLRILAKIMQKGMEVAQTPLPSRRSATRAARRLKLPAPS